MSRQLWWGHRIPVWYVEGSDAADYIVARCEEDAYKTARAKYGENVKLIQESDVLDTWFSRYKPPILQWDRLLYQKNWDGYSPLLLQWD